VRHEGVSVGTATCTDQDRAPGEVDAPVACWHMAPLKCDPGTQFHYGISTDVVGYLCEVLSGQRLDAFLRECILEPLGMVDTGFAVADVERLQASAARGLTRFVGRQQELLTLQPALLRAGAGHGQVVAGVGEAGVGKSCLVYEFVHSHHTSG
jgi:CubicO group peptidase (beta-lactamase class C family)